AALAQLDGEDVDRLLTAAAAAEEGGRRVGRPVDRDQEYALVALGSDRQDVGLPVLDEGDRPVRDLVEDRLVLGQTDELQALLRRRHDVGLRAAVQTEAGLEPEGSGDGLVDPRLGEDSAAAAVAQVLED